MDWPEDGDDQPADDGVHGKTRALIARAAGRSFVWVDDEIRDADRDWVAQHHPGQALLYRVDPRTGLDDGHFAAINRRLERERSLSQE